MRNPQFDILMKLARFYNSSLDYILGLSDRSNIYIDDLSERDQRIIKKAVEAMKAEMNR